MKKKKFCSFMVVILFLCGSSAFAQTTYIVDQQGSGDFSLIQDCIDASEQGDTCRVNSGTYVENINFAGKNITLISTSGPETTVIDGSQSGSVVTFTGSETKDAEIDPFDLTSLKV